MVAAGSLVTSYSFDANQNTIQITKPNGVLFGSTKAATRLRELLLTDCDLQAVINLPSGIFKPYAGVATAALVFQKGTPTKSVWFYDLGADGFSLDDKRTPVDANDTHDNGRWMSP